MAIKFFLSLGMITCISGVAFSQSNTSCSSFRTGKFLFKNNIGKVYTVIRKKNKEVDINNSDHSRITKKIVWIDDCNLKVYLPKYYQKDLPPAIVTIRPLSDSTFISACDCGQKSTDTLILYNKKRLKKLNLN